MATTPVRRKPSGDAAGLPPPSRLRTVPKHVVCQHLSRMHPHHPHWPWSSILHQNCGCWRVIVRVPVPNTSIHCSSRPMEFFGSRSVHALSQNFLGTSLITPPRPVNPLNSQFLTRFLESPPNSAIGAISLRQRAPRIHHTATARSQGAAITLTLPATLLPLLNPTSHILNNPPLPVRSQRHHVEHLPSSLSFEEYRHCYPTSRSNWCQVPQCFHDGFTVRNSRPSIDYPTKNQADLTHHRRS